MFASAELALQVFSNNQFRRQDKHGSKATNPFAYSPMVLIKFDNKPGRTN